MLTAGTFLMATAGWWCQFVRYPAFRDWTPDNFLRRHALHTLQISLVVMPGLILQIAGSAMLVFSSTPGMLKVLNVVCLFGSLVPTFLISAPLHGRLSNGKKEAEIEQLIRTNLPRTWFWTAHLLVAVLWLSLPR